MNEILNFLERLKGENLEFSLSYKEHKTIQININAGSEFWQVEFGESGLVSINKFSQLKSTTEPTFDTLEYLFNRVQRAWLSCANELKIEMNGNYTFYSPQGERFEAPVYLPEFGSNKGALLFLPNSEGAAIDAAHSAGYYVSLLSDISSFDHYEPESFKEILIDIGWRGPENRVPTWYNEV